MTNGSDGGDTKFVVPRELREELSELADEQWVADLAKEKTGKEYTRRYSRVLAAILPETVDDDDVISQELVTIEPIDEDLAAKVRKMSGDNVAAQDVIAHCLEKARADHEFNWQTEEQQEDGESDGD